MSTAEPLTPSGREERLDLDALEAIARAVSTPGDIDAAPEGGAHGWKESGHWYGCPTCDGQGEVEGATYCNFDNKPLGVQFFGIGAEFGQWEAYFRALRPETVLRLIAAARHPISSEDDNAGGADTARAGEGWRPIETAPQDGSIIDVWRPEGGRDTVFWGYPHHECGEAGSLCDSDWHRIRAPGWVCNTFGEFLGRKHAPFTHWMPLPAAPTPTQEGADDNAGAGDSAAIGRCYVCGEPAFGYVWDISSDLPACPSHLELDTGGRG